MTLGPCLKQQSFNSKTYANNYKQHIYVRNACPEHRHVHWTLAWTLGHFWQDLPNSFWENNEIQAAHWARKQCSLYTAMLFINQGGVRRQEKCVIISDTLSHKALEAYAFNNCLNQFLFETFPERKYQFYMSDGAGGIISFENYITLKIKSNIFRPL